VGHNVDNTSVSRVHNSRMCCRTSDGNMTRVERVSPFAPLLMPLCASLSSPLSSAIRSSPSSSSREPFTRSSSISAADLSKSSVMCKVAD
jgi:hypothetical protein